MNDLELMEAKRNGVKDCLAELEGIEHVLDDLFAGDPSPKAKLGARIAMELVWTALVARDNAAAEAIDRVKGDE